MQKRLLKIINLLFILFIAQGCALLSSAPSLFNEEDRLQVYVEPTFSEDPIYNIKRMVDEGWNLTVIDNKLVFTRTTSEGVETYKPK